MQPHHFSGQMHDLELHQLREENRLLKERIKELEEKRMNRIYEARKNKIKQRMQLKIEIHICDKCKKQTVGGIHYVYGFSDYCWSCYKKVLEANGITIVEEKEEK